MRDLTMVILASVAVSGAATRAMASEVAFVPVVPDRPSFTTGAQIIPKGMLQVEAGYTLSRADGVDSHSLGELNVRVPILPRLEIDLLPGGWQHAAGAGASSSGFADAAIGCKFKVHDKAGASGVAGRVDLAVLAGTVLPTGSRAVAEHALQPWVALSGDISWSERLSSTANLGISDARDAGDRFAQLSGGLAVALDLGHGVGSYLEGFTWQPMSGTSDAEYAIDGGLAIGAGHHAVVDVRGGIALSGSTHSFFAGAGLTVRF